MTHCPLYFLCSKRGEDCKNRNLKECADYATALIYIEKNKEQEPEQKVTHGGFMPGHF